MHIKSLNIENYKSFLDRQDMRFDQGFNILVGANNSGKTSVLEAVEISEVDARHRSIQTIPVFGGINSLPSSISVEFQTDFNELRKLVGNEVLKLPTGGPFSAETLVEIKKVIEEGRRVNLTFETSASTQLIVAPLVSGANQGLAGSDNDSSSHWVHISPNSGVQPSFRQHSGGHEITQNLINRVRSKIYRFSANRRPSASCAPSTSTLNRDAENLAFCINHLQTSDAHGHGLLCGWMQKIFPEIKWVQSPAQPSGWAVLQCLPEHPSLRRQDLARPLDTMGLGVGNVIAMLYVILTARNSQIILIDEPNAFLHPKALRELLAILEEVGKGHQFIIAAHSPDVLTSIKPATVTMLKLDQARSVVRQVNNESLRQLSADLIDLGIRMTDLHAKDRVIWVEGQTEEAVIPSILKWAVPDQAAGTAVLRVEHTGTFDRKGVDPLEVLNVYERLSQSSSLVPPSVFVLLDRENRSEQKMRALEDRSSGKLVHLDRPMLESYVLCPQAVYWVLKKYVNNLTIEQVEESMSRHSANNRIGDEPHAANVLKATFAELSSSKIEYRKTLHTPALFEWVLSMRPHILSDLRTQLQGLFVEHGS